MVNLKTIRLPFSANIKLALVAFAFAIVAGTLYYTNHLVGEMRKSEQKTVQFYANTFQRLINTPPTESDATETDVSNLIFRIGEMIDFPVIFTDKHGQPMMHRLRDGRTAPDVSWVKNVEVDTTLPPDVQREQLSDEIASMGKVYEPLRIYTVTALSSGTDSTLTNYAYFDDSHLVKQLQRLPFIEMIIISMFIVVGYISFSYIKRNEQSNIWVGMAKETAHQLGTPLSSLLGWIELLRYDPTDSAQVIEAAEEMQRDVQRLNKISQRFSKIGSAAEVRPVELNSVLGNVIQYFERRLPHLGKRVTLTLEGSPTPVYAAINTDLFEWVFENLVRNAADAIDHVDGQITIRIHELRNTAIIDVTDNGRGIDPKIRKDIFRPGFSTKQRGWGLGLSLAKRIVEEYHGGRIVLKQSSASGSTFRIRIPSVPAPAAADQPEAAPETETARRGLGLNA
ncbi:MAG TPA: HAMP domain-containing sensor histidine kinase [Candidatus Kapabacteria bacterium]|nr:HAMP domain-containing sensor histidine kinase [Candidatus Kapabacteria bacterium]